MTTFLEVEYSQFFKKGQRIGGDVFQLRRLPKTKRTLCTLADGLGSGVKANVLASMTASMAQRFGNSSMDIRKGAEIILDTLPICQERHISYSTFTLVDIKDEGTIKIVEYDNPPALLYRGSESLPMDRTSLPMKQRFPSRSESLTYSECNLQVGDRVIFFTDGVSQSGIGSGLKPLGWRRPDIEAFISGVLESNPDISARNLSREITNRAKIHDRSKPKDDITCAVVYIRKPRDLLIATGPSIDEKMDRELAKRVDEFPGRVILAGGTTANIVGRELGRSVDVDLSHWDPDIPPPATMKGAELVTEGMLTLSRVLSELEESGEPSFSQPYGVRRFLELLTDSDRIFFLVGTKINEAHQDPHIPQEMEIRRSMVRRICRCLEESHWKKTSVEFI